MARRYRMEEGQIGTLQSIADEEGLSRERIRQIVRKALRKISQKANREIKAQRYQTDGAMLVHHLRAIISPDRDGHIDRLISYLVDDFGYLPPGRESLKLLIQLVYKSRDEKEKYLAYAQTALMHRLAGTTPSSRHHDSKVDVNVETPVDRNRKEGIVRWLAASKFALSTESVAGFCVVQGSQIRLRDGRLYELVEWLQLEGIVPGESIAGYEISVISPGDAPWQQLLFSSAPLDRLTKVEMVGPWDMPSPERQLRNREADLPTRAYAPWNIHEDTELLELFDKGMSVEDLAQYFSRQPSAIKSRLRKLDVD